MKIDFDEKEMQIVISPESFSEEDTLDLGKQMQDFYKNQEEHPQKVIVLKISL